MTPAPAELSLAALVFSFTGGVLIGINPCCYAMIPAIFGYLGGYCEPRWSRCSWLSLWLGAGIASATVLLGLPVMLLGGLFGVHHPLIRHSLPLVPIAMGLHLLGIINLRMPKISLPRPVGSGAPGAFLSGFAFSLAILPCATPVLASILSYTIAQNRPIHGSVLLFA